jgi:hypothetical protein
MRAIPLEELDCAHGNRQVGVVQLAKPLPQTGCTQPGRERYCAGSRRIERYRNMIPALVSAD